MREGKKRKSGEKHGVVVPFIYLCIHRWDGIHNLGVSRRSSNQLSYIHGQGPVLFYGTIYSGSSEQARKLLLPTCWLLEGLT